MGFISSSSTITVQAKLTDAGKKKLYDSIENTNSGFITKFAVGDSDANYAAIEAGTSQLLTGHVPEASAFKPSLRSYLLYKGNYRPGVPVILIDNQYGGNNGLTKQLSVGSNIQASVLFSPTTEWPKDEVFTESYKVSIQNPGNISQSSLDRLFTISYQATGQWKFQFNGNISLDDIGILAGAYASGNMTVIPLKILGLITNAYIMYNIQLVQ